MRNQILERVEQLLRIIADDELCREAIALKMPELTKDQLGNLLSDLEELQWIERRVDTFGLTRFRLGFELGMIWRYALDREKAELQKIAERIEMLIDGDSELNAKGQKKEETALATKGPENARKDYAPAERDREILGLVEGNGNG